jgi:2-polyprenyl-3-methyl-5-hydroxy-6-metoxy-1,4-benzoquinol methylase
MKDYYSRGLRAEIVQMIPPGCKTVLDVGCGNGVLGEYLKKNGVERVAGIEIAEKAARNASSVLDEVLTGNIESMDLPFDHKSFDCVVCADVLEHLVDPWCVIGKLKKLVKPGGCIVASIPNIGFHRVVRNLLKGQWRYEDAGVLDRTHLRFFTLEGIKELFEVNSMKIEEIHRKIDSGANMKILNFLLGNSLKESLIIQYVVRARVAI